MAVAGAGGAAQRKALYDRLAWRNRLVYVLRWLVPLFAVIGLGVFAGKLVLASFGGTASGARVSIDRGALVIDKPHYQGVTADGTRYTVDAAEGSAALASPDVLTLKTVSLRLVRRDGTTFTASAPLAHYNLVAQTVEAPGVMHVKDSRGTIGDLENADFDWSTQVLRAKNGAQLVFKDGTTLAGESLTYDGAASQWVFKKAILETGK